MVVAAFYSLSRKRADVLARLLLVEDNPDLAFGLRANLELEGHQVYLCDDGQRVLSDIKQHRPDLLILDVMLPNRDGFQLLDDIRAAGFEFPVLMLTARSEEAEMVFALRRGADDYVTKPFGLMELLARVDVLLRRHQGNVKDANASIELGEIRIHQPSRQVWLKDEEVKLTPKEYDLLMALIEAPNQVLSRQKLLRKVWEHSADVASRTVDTHIAELRRKLEKDPARPAFLLTSRSAGYWLKMEKSF